MATPNVLPYRVSNVLKDAALPGYNRIREMGLAYMLVSAINNNNNNNEQSREADSLRRLFCWHKKAVRPSVKTLRYLTGLL